MIILLLTIIEICVIKIFKSGCKRPKNIKCDMRFISNFKTTYSTVLRTIYIRKPFHSGLFPNMYNYEESITYAIQDNFSIQSLLYVKCLELCTVKTLDPTFL